MGGVGVWYCVFCARFKFGVLFVRVGGVWWLVFSWVVWLLVGFVWVDFVACVWFVLFLLLVVMVWF